MTVKIYCTVEEFAEIVRGCHDTQYSGNCAKCALYRLCRESDGNATQYVSADTILPEPQEEAEHS